MRDFRLRDLSVDSLTVRLLQPTGEQSTMTDDVAALFKAIKHGGNKERAASFVKPP